MSGAINWCTIGAAFRKGGLAMGLKELDRQGYAVVPKEPTAEMVEAGWDWLSDRAIEDIYKSMIDAGEVSA